MGVPESGSVIGVPESGGGLERWIKIAVMSSICHDYVVCSNSWQFRPCILSLLSAHSISMRFAQIATRARLHHHIGHRSQEFNLFRLQLFFATTVAWSSCVTCVERLQCWQRSAPRPSALQALLPPPPPALRTLLWTRVVLRDLNFCTCDSRKTHSRRFRSWCVYDYLLQIIRTAKN